ncbi:hypothetical protein J4573_05945 [Actinomadura barringtoniae]|uniref:Uncharacterized protein n=1 Tax=Actinomadura barringtoniae TaxID=1427535 RepID=A0A939PBL7_9ACTN|nr:hypothetical protein [Actinomadura barringtoniae]MBO2446624.1 hypothetical protein [Actinomadura barringtoniae]
MRSRGKIQPRRGLRHGVRVFCRKLENSERRQLALLGLVAVLAAFVLGGAVRLFEPDDEGPPPVLEAPPVPTPAAPEPSPTVPPSPTPTDTPEASGTSRAPAPPPDPPRNVPAVTIARPGTDERLMDDRDFDVFGTVHALGDNDLRLFLFSARRQLFYLADYRAEDVPNDGRWHIESTGIGEHWGHTGDVYVLLAVLADGSCRRVLDGLELGHDRYPAFNRLPNGCRAAAQVRVIEDNVPT